MVECECVRFCCRIRSRIGFNRYMVECEYCILDVVNSYFESFNRYMVECEYQRLTEIENRGMVLIDTWWNVNYLMMQLRKAFNSVLIDTWWNVNAEQGDVSEYDLSVLIDTWWNVNSI